MEKFEVLKGHGAVLPLMNVDTDMIIPKQFLKTIKRTGLGKSLFYELRYGENGSENPDFPLNTPEGRTASILVSGANFGCGSSREHAPWALLDFGIRCVIAPSFADIFYNNCFKNGILPLVLPKETVDDLAKTLGHTPDLVITVDLARQTVSYQNTSLSFEIEPFRKECLLGGLDDIGLTLLKMPAIEAYEDHRLTTHPWL